MASLQINSDLKISIAVGKNKKKSPLFHILKTSTCSLYVFLKTIINYLNIVWFGL